MRSQCVFKFEKASNADEWVLCMKQARPYPGWGTVEEDDNN
jgi:hypothetical protein